ncbi:MAG: hypothetical protein JWN14_3360 [Chthonomonadales bacterium]|nr:hypothetical protein [Chthonomonadales bacterium]
MNTKNILTIMLVAPALIATLSNAQAQVPEAGDKAPKAGKPGQAALRTDKISTEQAERGYLLPAVRKPITNSSYKPTSEQDKEAEALLEQHGYTFARRNDLWLATPRPLGLLLARQIQANQTAPDHKVQTTGNVLSDTYSKSFEAGNRNILFGEAKFSLTHSGSQNLARLQSDAEINGAILGDFGNLAKATADFKAPVTGIQTAAMNLTVLGHTVWTQNKSGATATINDGFTFSGKILDVPFSHKILGIGIDADLFISGSVSAHFNGVCTPNKVQVNASAGGNLSVGGHAGVDVLLASANLNANIVLADVLFNGDAGTISSMGKSKLPQLPNGPILTVEHHVNDNLSFGKGSASIELDLVGKKVGSFTLFDEPNGLFHTSGVLESYDKVYDLPVIGPGNKTNTAANTGTQPERATRTTRKQ